MKSRILFLTAILFLIIFCSCSQQAGSTVSINASTQKDQWFKASRSTHIDISQMDPTVLYAVKTKSGRSRGLLARDVSTSESILTTEAGTNIPVPDENNSCSFVGGDVNITSDDEIQLVELKAGTDCTLHATGEPNFITEDGDRVWEEYYYVDLTQPPYDFSEDELKRMTLASFITTGNGGAGRSDCAIVSTNFTAVADENSGMFGTFDLTGYTGVILYNKVGIINGENWTQTVLLQPTNLISCDGSTTEINDFYDVLQIDASTAVAGKEYVLVIKTYEPGSYSIGKWNTPMTSFTDGTSRGFAVPITSDEADASVIYMGEIDPSRDFLIDCPIYNTDQQTKHYADVYIREISETEKNLSKITLSPSGTTVFTVDVPARTVFKTPLMVTAEDEELKKNLYITIQCNYLNDDGSLGDIYGEGDIGTWLNVSHDYGTGMGTKPMEGSYTKRLVSSHELLENITLLVGDTKASKNLRFTITIEKSEEPLEMDYPGEDGWMLYVVPNNGSPIQSVKVKNTERYGLAPYTLPAAPSRPGYSFKSWSIRHTLYQPGETIMIDSDNSIVAVWDKL